MGIALLENGETTYSCENVSYATLNFFYVVVIINMLVGKGRDDLAHGTCAEDVWNLEAWEFRRPGRTRGHKYSFI